MISPLDNERPKLGSHSLLALAGVLLLLAVGCGGSTEGSSGEVNDLGIDLTPPLPLGFDLLDPRASLPLEALYQRVLEAPRDVELRRQYAAALHSIPFEDAAMIAWIQAAALDLSDPRSRHHLGRLRAARGDFEGAVEAFSSAAALDASYAPTRWRLGLALYELERFDEARLAFQDAQALAPRDPSGAAGLARIALEMDDLETAGKLLETLIEEHPNDGYLSKLLARVKRRQGDEANAALLLSRATTATRCFRGDPWVRELSNHRAGFAGDLERAQELIAAGRQEDALALLEPLYAEDPGHLAVEGLTVRALLALDQTERAQTILRESLARGDHPRTQVSLGFVHFVCDELTEALACSDRAIAVQPDLANAHFLRAKALVALGRGEEGVQALEAAFERGEASLEARLLFGRSLAEMNAIERAVEALTQATEAYPSSLQAWAMRCEVEIMADRIVDARRSLAEVAARDVQGLHLPRLAGLLGEGEASLEGVPFDDLYDDGTDDDSESGGL